MNSPSPSARGASVSGMSNNASMSNSQGGNYLVSSSTTGGTNTSTTTSSSSNGGGGGIGATQKHLEFQLQRERSTVSSLQEKIKALHSQVAQLEQEKAELRREKISMAEENRKNSRAEEHLGALRKELEAKEKACKEERQRAAEAKVETEEVRRNAHLSISQWMSAEKKWGEREAALQAQLKELSESYQILQQEQEVLRNEKLSADALCHHEQERAQKAEQRCNAMEADLRIQGEQLEKHQNKAFAYETDIDSLRRAEAHLHDVLEQREAECRAIKLEQERLIQENEKLLQSISTYQDRLNKEKTVQMNLVQEKTLRDCDVQAATKEVQHLTRLLESERKERALAQRREEQHTAEVEEWKSRIQSIKNEVKTKEAAIREKVLSNTQLNMQIQKLEAQLTLQKAEHHQQGLELEQVNATRTMLQEKIQTMEEENVLLQTALEEVKQQLTNAENNWKASQEELAAQGRHHQAEVEQWQQDLASRQEAVEALTTQLQALNQQQQHLHQCLEKNSLTAHHQQARVELLSQASLEKEECFGTFTAVTLAELVPSHLLQPLSYTLFTTRTEHEAYVEQMTARWSRLNEEHHRLVEHHSDIQERLEMLHVENESLRAQWETTVREKKQEWEMLQNALQAQVQELQEDKKALTMTKTQAETMVAALEQTKMELSKEMEAMKGHWSTTQQEQEGQRRCLSALFEYNEQLFASVVERKTEFLWESVCSHAQRAFREACSKREKLVSLEEKCAGVEQLLAESNALLRQQHHSSEETFRALHAHIEKWQERVGDAQRESQQSQDQLIRTLEQWDAEKLEWEKAMAEHTTASEKRLAELEVEVQKLRKGLEYELSRKTEYKMALERVKRYRAEEVNQHLSTQEQTAMEVHKANTEILYWREQYGVLREKFQRYKQRHPPRAPAALPSSHVSSAPPPHTKSLFSDSTPSSSYGSQSSALAPTASPPEEEQEEEEVSKEGKEKQEEKVKGTHGKENDEKGGPHYHHHHRQHTNDKEEEDMFPFGLRPQFPARLNLTGEPSKKRAKKEAKTVTTSMRPPNAITEPRAASSPPPPLPSSGSSSSPVPVSPAPIEGGRGSSSVTSPSRGTPPLTPPALHRALAVPPVRVGPADGGREPQSRGTLRDGRPISTSPPTSTTTTTTTTALLPYRFDPTTTTPSTGMTAAGAAAGVGSSSCSPSPPSPARTSPASAPLGRDKSSSEWRAMHGLREVPVATSSPLPPSPPPSPTSARQPAWGGNGMWRTSPHQRSNAVERTSGKRSEEHASLRGPPREETKGLKASMTAWEEEERRVGGGVGGVYSRNEKPTVTTVGTRLALGSLSPLPIAAVENGRLDRYPAYPYPQRGPGERSRGGEGTPPPPPSTLSSSSPLPFRRDSPIPASC